MKKEIEPPSDNELEYIQIIVQVEAGVAPVDDNFFRALELRHESFPEQKVLILNPLVKKAIIFANEVHEGQKRKTKPVAYITHLLRVGEILGGVTDDEEIIAAGILHDTIEDSKENNKITVGKLTDIFGNRIAKIVNDVTEQDKNLEYHVRKAAALAHIPYMTQDSLLVKAADLLDNLSDLRDDIVKHGPSVFKNFNAPKEQNLENKRLVIDALRGAWPENPLLSRLDDVLANVIELSQ